MTAVIIDDEVYCTDVVSILTSKYCPEVEIAAVFNHSVQALEYLKKQQPDIIFMDIEMPQMNGFELLQQIGDVSSRIIFTTAYDQYAIQAFKFNAVDYLLKPIDKDELIAAVKKSAPKLQQPKIEHLQYLSQTNVPEKILLPIGNEIIFVQVKDITCCEAEGSYCKVYIMDKEKPYLLSRTLRDIEELLNNPGFFRPHTSWLIHDIHIQKIIRTEGMEIVLHGDIHVPVARSKKQEVMDRLMK
ncbi:MAG: response regulator transcription factor [Saprospiraceae bacterium]|nr:response regulator transcription factor [Saprospiraceae bacterium]MBK8670929.1 response regulator transcription factor [Saprospiraceae bacterium]